MKLTSAKSLYEMSRVEKSLEVYVMSRIHLFEFFIGLSLEFFRSYGMQMKERIRWRLKGTHRIQFDGNWGKRIINIEQFYSQHSKKLVRILKIDSIVKNLLFISTFSSKSFDFSLLSDGKNILIADISKHCKVRKASMCHLKVKLNISNWVQSSLSQT